MNLQNKRDADAQSQRSGTSHQRKTKKSEVTAISEVSSSKNLKKTYKGELKEGIVGLKNNSLYCYMNACLQCLIPIYEMRDYYLNAEYRRFHECTTLSDSNDYSRKFEEFYRDAYSYDSHQEKQLNPTGLKNLIRKKFYPTMQHDSHEFLMHVLGSL